MIRVILSILFFSSIILANAQVFNQAFVSNRASISDDGNYMIFQSNQSNGFQLYESIRENAIWTEPKPINTINMPFHGLYSMGQATLNGAGNFMIFSARTDNTNGFDLFFSNRINGVWEIPKVISLSNSSEFDMCPAMDPEGMNVFFLRNTQDSCRQLYTCKRTDQNKFSAPEKVSDVYMQGIEIFKDAKTVWVHSKVAIDIMVNGFHVTSTLPFDCPGTVNQMACSLDDAHWLVSDGSTIKSHTIKFDEHILGAGYRIQIKSSETKTHQPTECFLVIRNKDRNDSVKISGTYDLYLPAVRTDTFLLKYYASSYIPILDTVIISKRELFKVYSKELEFKSKKKKYVFNVTEDGENTLMGKIKVVNALTGEEQWLEADPTTAGGYSVYLNEGEDYSLEISDVKGKFFKIQDIDVAKDTNRIYRINRTLSGIQFHVGETYRLKNIYFAKNSFVLSDSSMYELGSLVHVLKQNPTMTIKIEAHTDGKGDPASNIKLSKKRASVVVAYLVKNGIALNRLSTEAFGSTRPCVVERNELDRSKNRRFEIKILTL